MNNTIMDIIRSKVENPGISTAGLGQVAVFIAGPIDEDYQPKVNNHHWEVATLAPVLALGLVIDLKRSRVIDQEVKRINDSHGWLSLTTRGKEHTLGVLLVFGRGPVKLMVPLNATNVDGIGPGYLPVVVTFIGRNRKHGYKNVITQWHEELLKFVIGGVIPQ